MLLTAFLAGFILNFMPCVLPVIGLKVLSFVEQSGNDRKRILMLNVWYALGMLFVFWVLATIPVVLRIGFGQSFGWGQQFSFDGFNITLTAIVFVMALSFLGVGTPPEIPSWGQMLGDARNFLAQAPWTMVAPGVALMVTVLGLNLLGDGIRDLLDPRLRRQG